MSILKTQEKGLVLAPAKLTPGRPGPAAVYLASLKAGPSRETMRQSLELLARITTSGRCTAETMPWWQLRYEVTQAIRTKLAAHGAPNTANRHLSALRGVLKEAWRLGLMTAEDYHRARDLQNIKGKRLPRGRAVEAGELSALTAACNYGRSQARDVAVLGVLYMGLRRDEAAALKLSDFDSKAKTLRVLGKGNKERSVPLPDGSVQALLAWIIHRGHAPGPLFAPVHKSGAIQHRKFVGDSIYRMALRMAERAGISRFTPHDMRRTCVTELFDRDVDIGTIKSITGHELTETLLIYDRRGEGEKSKAAQMLHFPYHPKRR